MACKIKQNTSLSREGEASVLFFVLVCKFFPFKTKNV